MRVLQLIDSLNIGGAERMAVNIANALQPEIDASFLCVTREEGALNNSLDAKVNYLFLNKKSALDLKTILKLRRFIKKNKINVIHAHSTSYFYGTLLKLLCIDIKLIWHDHHGNRQQTPFGKKIVIKMCSIFFDQILVVNKDLFKWAKRHLYCQNIEVINNFPINNPSVGNPKLGGQEGKRILCVANLRTPKNHLLLLESFKQIHDQHPSWSLHCVGEIYDDAYSKAVLSEIKEMNLEDAVYLHDLRTDISDVINACEIGVLASTFEGLPMALLEYSLGGLAIVATDVGDVKKIVLNESMGTLVFSHDLEAFTNGILVYIENPEKRNEAALKIKNHVENNFSMRQIVDQLLRIYKN